eukprot:TRINITY_DN11647_c0_g1_i1.p1 TRINITY_DN11647_c0_g1~~TRINITY_DN11647_c0_g1_i1.p1  ORF type:complete len:392 (+),score=20.55 TRINITY_DN11647_c0_g1_i1:168-1343(+)
MALQAATTASLKSFIAAPCANGAGRTHAAASSQCSFVSGSSKISRPATQGNVAAFETGQAGNAASDRFIGSSPNARRGLTVRAQAGESVPKVGPVAVVGGTGFVGRALVEALLAEGEKVKVLTRSVERAQQVFPGAKGAIELVGESGWAGAIAGSRSVVNLAGTPISTRWSPGVKAAIISSRVETTRKVVDAINSLPKDKRPAVLVNTSAVGFYGSSESATFDETSASGNDFLAEVCRKWEGEASKVDTRLVVIRFGIVLDKDGGALGKMLPIFQLFAGGPLGTGQQWMSWVHRDDLVALIIESLRSDAYSGVINGTAPAPVRMGQFCDELGAVLGRPSWLPVPDFAIQALLGEGSAAVLNGQKVLPARTQSLGFKFKYNSLREALKEIFS